VCQLREWPTHKARCKQFQKALADVPAVEADAADPSIQKEITTMIKKALAARPMMPATNVICVSWTKESFVGEMLAMVGDDLEVLGTEGRKIVHDSFAGYDVKFVVRGQNNVCYQAFTLDEFKKHRTIPDITRTRALNAVEAYGRPYFLIMGLQSDDSVTVASIIK
jgi:hypothetical protein